jgi:chromosome segregation ATPase
MQAELAALQLAHKDLQNEKNGVNEQLNRTTEELVSLRATSGGSVAKLEEVTRSLKDERSRSKQLEQQLEAVNDEYIDCFTSVYA